MNNSKNSQTPNTGRIKLVTEKILGLPTLPTVVSKMLELVDNPNTSAKSLAALISTDQSLTAKILKIANSAYYGLSRKISTVDNAVIVMGFNAVKEMGLSISVFNIFKGLTNIHHFDIAQFWRHSIGCGVASKIIAHRFGKDQKSEAFVAGLLHDIGKVVINQYFHKEFVRIISEVAEKKSTLDEAEIEILGAQHGEIGAWLANRWRLPVNICESIQYHHAPWDAEENPVFTCFINIANYMCHLSNIGSSGRVGYVNIDEKALDVFYGHDIPFDVDIIEDLQSELFIEMDRTEIISSSISENEW